MNEKIWDLTNLYPHFWESLSVISYQYLQCGTVPQYGAVPYPGTVGYLPYLPVWYWYPTVQEVPVRYSTVPTYFRYIPTTSSSFTRYGTGTGTMYVCRYLRYGPGTVRSQNSTYILSVISSSVAIICRILVPVPRLPGIWLLLSSSSSCPSSLIFIIEPV